MPGKAGTLDVVAHQLGLALQPLEEQLQPERFLDLLAALGLRLPPQALQPAVTSALNAGSSAAAALRVAVTQLATAIASDNTTSIAANGAKVLVEIKKLIDALNPIATALGAAAGGLPGINVAEMTAFANELPSSLIGHLVIGRAEGTLPSLVGPASLLGVIDYLPSLGVAGDATHPRHVRKRLQLQNIGKALSGPKAVLESRFKWGAPGFDGTLLLPRLAEALSLAGMSSYVDGVGSDVFIDAGMFTIGVTKAPAPPGLELTLHYDVPTDFSVTLPLTKLWSLGLKSRGSFAAGLKATATAPSNISLKPKPPAGALTGLLQFALTAKGPNALILIGEAGGSRLQMDSLTFAAGLPVTWNPAAGVAEGQPTVTIDVAGGKAIIDTSNGDGFIATILGGFALEAGFDLGVSYSIADGLRFGGSGGLEVQLAQHIALGPVEVENLTLALGIKGDAFPIGIKTDLKTSLGPLSALVHRLGFEVAIRLKADNTGNLGPVDLAVRFVPPTGVGLSIDAGGFKGGGVLLIDVDKGEYGGGLELDFVGIVTVKAVALLSTKFPDGHRGFALVIIISAEFAPIQLGLGFTLVGVGGLLGLNRTVDTDALKEGVHQGALDSVLFPRDVVRNAPRIVNDLRRLFPAAENHFLIGPMAKFGWGTPTIVSLEFGLILDLPRPAFFVIGRLRIGLPFQDAPLFDIRVAFAGGVDFEAGQLWFEGTLHDSRVLAFPLTGDMAIRLYWKQDANFVLTIGGFHPAYTPPPMALGQLQRLGITIFNGNPRLRAEAYVAITSNTVQFGAKAELYFGVDVFNVYGFIALDVLIQFDPFRFVATLTAMLAVRTGIDTLMGIRIEALLEGPAPWHAKGTGHFEISLIIDIEIDVGFEVTIGEERKESIPAVAALPKLAEAFAHKDNWRAVLPAGGHLHVSLRKFEPPAGAIVLHPAGSLEITQKLLPLQLPIQKLGTQRISDGHVFAVERVMLGTTPGQLEPLREQFAPAQFVDMSDALKLSSRSFEKYEAGVRVGGGSDARADHVKTLEVAYEVIYIPNRPVRPKFRIFDTLFNLLARGGAVAKSPLSTEQNAPSPIGAGKVIAAAERFAVASRADLSVHNTSMVFSTEAEARAAMHAAVGRDPALTRTLQVVPYSLTKAS